MTENISVDIDPDLTNPTPHSPVITKKTAGLLFAASAVILGTGIVIGMRYGADVAADAVDLAQDAVDKADAIVKDTTK